MLMRKLSVMMLLLLVMLMFSAMLMMAPVAKAEGEEDPFSYTPTTYSASVSQGGSTSPTITLGIKTPPTLPSSAFPVTTTGWDKSTLPSGWTLTDAIQSPKTTYTWSSTSDTVTVILTLGVPTAASPTTYTFTLKLKPGTRADGGSAVGAGDGVAFTITVTVPTVSITVTSSPTGSGFVKVDDTPIATPATFSWKPGDTHKLEALSPVADPIDPTGTQYVWTSWSDGGAQTHTYTVPSSAETVTATYDTYYWVQYAANVPVTLPADEWVKSGEAATGVFPTEEISDGTKYVFVSDDRPATITAPTTITATYKTQYLVSFTQTGSAVAPTVDYQIDSGSVVTDTVPCDVWVDATHQISYTYQAIVPGGTGVRYVLVGVDPESPQTVNGPLTITGTYKTQYEITVTASPAGAIGGTFKVTYIQCGTTYTGVEKATSWTEWVDATKDVTVSEPQEYVPSEAGKDGVRYKFDHYDPSDSVTMDGAKTITLVYKTQYYLTMSTNFGTVSPGSGWQDAGTVLTISATAPSVVDGERYVWLGWTGTGTISYSDMANPATDSVTMNSPVTETAAWRHEFRLTMATNFGTTSPDVGEHWYEEGTKVDIEASAPSVIAGERYVWLGWTGSGSGSYSNGDNPASITMNGPITETAAWRHDYLLTVSTSPKDLSPQPAVTLVSGYDAGSGWYEASSVVSIDPNSPAGYTFDHWNGDASGSTVPLIVTMDSPKNIVAVFKFNLAVESGFKPGDSPSFASDPYLTDIMCVLIKATGGYKLVGTSPGTYDYAIAIKNTGTTTFTSIAISVTGSSDFILHSQNPIRVLNEYGDISSQFTVSGTWPTITISSKSGVFQGLLGSKSLYVTIHLDYAKKGTIVSSSLIYSKAYTFKTTVAGTSGPNSGTTDAYGSVVFLSKKATIIYGFVKTSSGMPIAGATVELYQGGTLKYTETTDADGFYCFIDGVVDANGVMVSLSGGVTYTVKCILPGISSQDVIAQSLKAVAVNFTKP